MNFRYAAWYAQALTVFDAVSTWLLIINGRAVEANPLLLPVMAHFGTGIAMVLRAVLGIALVELLYQITKELQRLQWTLVFVSVVLTLVAAWHTYGWVVLT